MRRKNFILKSWLLLLLSLLLLAGFLGAIRPTATGKTHPSTAGSAGAPVVIPLIEIREDSLLSLVDYFVKAQNSHYTLVNRMKGSIALHLSRFSNTPSSFYCENKSLPGITDQGFQIKVDNQTNEIDVTFIRKVYKGVPYIAVPSDVLCGLLRLHPNIR